VNSWNRRQFVLGTGAVGLGLLAGCGRVPGQAQAPAVNVPRVSVFGASDVPHYRQAFRQGLRELGYVEGGNVNLEYRWADFKVDRYPDLAAELVGLPSDVIVTWDTAATEAAKHATSTIPIVMVGVADPVGQGLVPSLARPSGNVTGLTLINTGLTAKRLELLHIAVPGASRVAVLWNANNSGARVQWNAAQEAARVLELQLQSLAVRESEDFDDAFAIASRDRAEALLIVGEQLTINNRTRIVDFAAQSRLPAMYSARAFVLAGGLMCYGPNVNDSYRRAVYYVDRILRGTKSVDLPIEQPMTLDFMVNLKTAHELGITFPNEIMLQVTEVIDG
jgi:putative ABC transport system substrate-binding protein